MFVELTVALVAGVNAALQGFRLGELGQHLRQPARHLRGQLPAVTMVTLRKFQGQVPEGLHGIGPMVTGQARHLV